MATVQYLRVNRRRVCRICGKTDWCSYTRDEKISFCARITDNSNRVSRAGWGVFHHDEPQPPIKPLPFPTQSLKKSNQIAPIEIRHFAYKTLIELSPSTSSHEIINGPDGLRKRNIFEFQNHGSLPQSRIERRELAKLIHNLVKLNFPDLLRRNQLGISSIPGFWIDKFGKTQIWTDKNCSSPILVIPVRDKNGLIQACQLKFVGNVKPGNARYVWLSVPKASEGITSGTPLHIVSGISPDRRKPILVTEGVLKAETTRTYFPNLDIIAICCVACSHEALIEVSRFRPLLLAFDSDSRSNPQVIRQLANLIKKRLADSRLHGCGLNLKILSWSQSFKGIDDALIHGAPIYKSSFIEWFELLNEEAKSIVRVAFIDYFVN